MVKFSFLNFPIKRVPCLPIKGSLIQILGSPLSFCSSVLALVWMFCGLGAKFVINCNASFFEKPFQDINLRIL